MFSNSPEVGSSSLEDSFFESSKTDYFAGRPDIIWRRREQLQSTCMYLQVPGVFWKEDDFVAHKTLLSSCVGPSHHWVWTNKLQAITEMTRQLRSKKGQVSDHKNAGVLNGLILANGGVLTYQHVVCLSTKPRSDGKEYQNGNPCASIVQSVTSNDKNDLDIVGSEGVKNGVWEGIIEVRITIASKQIYFYTSVYWRKLE